MRSRVALAIIALIAAVIVPISPAYADGVETRTSIDVSPAGAVPAGTELTVTVTVGSDFAGTPSGEVVLAVNDVAVPAVELVDAVATFTVPGSSVLPGTLTLTAAYSGDADFSAGSAEAGVLVSFVDYPPVTGDQIAPFYADIRWMTGQSITAGYSDNGFHPTAAVTRQAMAAFLYRAAHPGAAAPTCASAPFPDVPSTHPFCGEIQWLAQQGISTGYSDGTFRPGVAVSRGAMAQFLHRFKIGGAAPACSTAPFSDVPASDPSCGAITWLVSKGITNGYGDGTFRTTAAVSRQAMAAFLHRLFGDAIRTLKTGSIELDPADLVSVSGDEVTVKSTATLPPVGGVLIVSAVNGGSGVFGTVVSIGPVSSGHRVVTIDTSATLDDAYSQLDIVATNLSIPDPVPGGGGMAVSARAGISPEFECTGPEPEITLDLTNIKISAFEIHLRSLNPRLSFVVTYDPSVTVEVPLGTGITCEVTATVLPPIVIPTPPIVIETGVYGYVTFSAGATVSVTAGIHLAASVSAHGTDVNTNFTHHPFASASVDASELSVQAGVGIEVSAKLADVVGLSGRLGVQGNVKWGPDELGRDCLTASIGPEASIEAVLDVFVHEFSATIIEGVYPQKEVFKRCYGGGLWTGEAGEQFVGSGTWQVPGAWSASDSTNLTRNYVLDSGVSTATASGSITTTFVNEATFPDYPCNTPSYIGDFEGPATGSTNDFYAFQSGGGFWPQVGTFTIDLHQHDLQGDDCLQNRTDAVGDHSFNPFTVRMSGPFLTGRTYELECDDFDPLPTNVQAIRLDLTLHCSQTAEDADEPHSGTATLTLHYDMIMDDCDVRVDSDGDGTGDCEEYRAGGDPNH